MKITLDGARVVEIPDESPTPKAVYDSDRNTLYVLDRDWDYTSIPYFRLKSGALVNTNGSVVFDGKANDIQSKVS
jgi:hypothetical protein